LQRNAAGSIRCRSTVTTLAKLFIRPTSVKLGSEQKTMLCGLKDNRKSCIADLVVSLYTPNSSVTVRKGDKQPDYAQEKHDTL